MHYSNAVLPPPFVGDLSTQDAAVLATMAQGRAVLEFGAGGSTQIFASVASRVVTMETDGDWILRTQRNLERLKLHEARSASRLGVHFMHYDLDALEGTGPFDLVFVDGESAKRVDFAIVAFRQLAEHGLIVFHDSRTGECAKALSFAATVPGQLSEILFDVAESNLVVMRKRVMPAYVDWNVEEDRRRWEFGGEEASDGFAELVTERSQRFFRPLSTPIPGESP